MMTSTLPHKEPEFMTEINITPFTDVLLVLLIIFMILAALATPPGFQKRFSGPPGKNSGPLANSISVKLTASGELFIDGVQVRPSKVYETMARAVRAHTSHAGLEPRILVFADANARYDWIIKVLDAARQAGDEDVGFVAP